jgi:uncharacterized oxidoreductase
METDSEQVRVSADRLEPFARRLTAAYGTPEAIAEQVAASLVAADLRGHRSHGVIRLGMLYREMAEAGGIDPAATPEVVAESPATATVDGNLAFGQAAGRLAVDTLAEKAERQGVAVVGLRNGAHIGRIGEWAERAAERDLLFAAWVNTGGLAHLVAPAGSTTRRLATNPLAFGVPSFGALEFPLVLDMATSQVAHGKLTRREVAGEPLPEGWAVNDDGSPMTDPERYTEGEGAMLPLGGTTAGYKGYGLATMAELFAGVLSDGVVAGGDPDGAVVNNSAAFLAVDPERFGSRPANRERVETLAAFLRAAEDSDGVPAGPAARTDGPLLPGEAEHLTRRERASAGIPFSRGTLDLLAEVAGELGVPEAVPDGFAPE